jgi:SAM-dependent methyltransferase
MFRLAAGIAVFLACLVALPACAPRTQELTPEIENFSDTLDVPFEPSDYEVLNAMFDLLKPTKNDFVIDLGSGDGRIVITAAKIFGARGYGVDLNEGLVKIANARAARAGIRDRARFYARDLFKEDISRASVVTMYLLPEVVLKLRPKLLAELKPGSRIVSHDYHLGNWRPDATRVVDVESQGQESIVYYWVVPAKVRGTWVLSVDYAAYSEKPLNYRAMINQDFQDIDGKVGLNSQTLRIHDARLSGARIAFSATGEIKERIIRHDFTGIVNGDTITGSVRLSGALLEITVPWTARRVKAAE